MNNYIKKCWVVCIYVVLVCAFSTNIFMLNQGDFSRSINPFADLFNINIHVSDVVSQFKMRDDFLGFLSFSYVSSHNAIVYAYALLSSLFSDYFNIYIYAVIIKCATLLTLYALLLELTGDVISYNKKQLLFLVLSIPFISSSNLAFASSLYQEQLFLVFIAALMIVVVKSKNLNLLACFVIVSLISTLKSQFFYLPLIMILFFIIYNKDNLRLKISLMVMALTIGVMSILFTNGTTNLNSYHSTYFGAYLYNELSGEETPSGVDGECIGIDAWGNKFDIEHGVVGTDIKSKCLVEAKKSGFTEAIKTYVNHPLDFLLIPFADSVKPYLGENYFHMTYRYRLITSQDNAFGVITEIKNAMFNGIRFPLLLIAFIISLVYRKSKLSGAVFIITLYGMSQFYVSFLGEGYRDLNKHLYGMNSCFDVLIYILFIRLVSDFFAIKNRRKNLLSINVD